MKESRFLDDHSSFILVSNYADPAFIVIGICFDKETIDFFSMSVSDTFFLSIYALSVALSLTIPGWLSLHTSKTQVILY